MTAAGKSVSADRGQGPQIFRRLRANTTRVVQDFGTLEGLQRLSGCPPEEFLRFVTKELLDNAADKRGVRNIAVTIIEAEGRICLSVTDDGEGSISMADVRKLVKFRRAPSSKRGVKALTRGALGNGFQVSLGISHTLWPDGERPGHTCEIVSGGKHFEISLSHDNEDFKARIAEKEASTPGAAAPSTTITFILPAMRYADPLSIIDSFAFLNGHVAMSYDGSFTKGWTCPRDADPPRELAPDIHQYDLDEFRALSREFAGTASADFVQAFLGFKGRPKYRKALERASIPEALPISEASTQAIEKLFKAMRQIAKPLRGRSLPVVGRKRLEHFGFDPYVLIHGQKTDRRGRSVPYAIEAASMLAGKGMDQGRIIEAVNFSPSLYRPLSRYILKKNGKNIDLHNLLHNKGRLVVVHLVSPNLEWLSADKGDLDTSLFKDDIFRAVGRVTRAAPVSSVATVEEIIDATKMLLEDYPTTNFSVRGVMYKLMARKGWPKMYAKVKQALTEGRDSRQIPADRIVDLSRPQYLNNPEDAEPAAAFRRATKTLMDDLNIDMWGSRPIFPEVVCEKDAVAQLLRPICRMFNVNLGVAKGYESWTRVHEAVMRFPTLKKILILYLGDLDPPGVHMQREFEGRLREHARLWGRPLNLEFKRVGLTKEQVDKFDLPGSPLNRKAQKAKEWPYEEAWELDALEPDFLNSSLRSEFEGLIDPADWKAKREKLETFKAKAEKMLRAVVDQLDREEKGDAA